MSVHLDDNAEITLVSGEATGLGSAAVRALGLCGATVAVNELGEDRVAAT